MSTRNSSRDESVLLDSDSRLIRVEPESQSKGKTLPPCVCVCEC